MHIEDLKRWHWIVISLVIGLVLSSVYSASMAEGGPGERRTISRDVFLMQLGRTTRDKNNNELPIVRNIRVFPPIEARNVVTLEELVITRDRASGKRSGEYQPRQFVAEVPFSLAAWERGGLRQRQPQRGENWSIVDELNLQKQNGRKFDYSYAAWASKPAIYGIFAGGSLLLVGIIWPTVLGRLQATGHGHAPRDPNAVDLSKVRSTASAPTKHAPTGPTAKDLAELAAVTSQYEKNVAGMAAGPAVHSGAKSPVAAQAQRNWDAAAVESPVAAAKPAEEHEFGGEFYPVDRGVKKKD